MRSRKWHELPAILRLLCLFLSLFSLFSLLAPLSPPLIPHALAANRPGAILVVYPKDGATINAPSTFLIGAIPRGTSLTANGQPVKVNGHGYFAHVVKLAYGSNAFRLALAPAFEESGQASADFAAPAQAVINIKRPAPAPPISPSTFKIQADSVSPSEDRGLVPGDIIEFSVRATPQSHVEVLLAGRRITLYPSAALRQKANQAKRQGKSTVARSVPGAAARSVPGAAARSVPGAAIPVNLGLDAAYGQVFQKLPAARPDLYVGYYKVASDDNWAQATPRFVLKKGAQETAVTGKARLTVISQPFLAHTIHDNTIVRIGPGQARITPLDAGVRLVVDGFQGNQVRCLYAAGKHVWIAKEDLALESGSSQWPGPARQPAVSGFYPASSVRTINTGTDGYGDVVSIPLTQRLPYLVEQSVKPNRLTLKIYGATADTDWISPQDVTQAEGADSSETPSVVGCRMIEQLDFRQVRDGVYQVKAQIRGDRQWGYAVKYEGTTLKLKVKHPPAIAAGQLPLSGLTVCVDPGHGGRETGSIGCSGVPESRVNLDISLKFKRRLESQGARVIMTRMRDDEERSLDERVRMAAAAQSDLLISIHNNALPDGRDPWKEHGTSTYFYHPQSIELARTLKQSVQVSAGFPDIGARFQNLALCRPTAMPACLVEVGFMIHPDEYAQLLDPSMQDRIAEGLLKGTMTYVLPR